MAGFYLRHPARFLDVLEQSYQASLAMRPKYLGNYERSSGLPAKTLSHRFSLWSDIKGRWFPRSVGFLFLYWSAYGFVCFRHWQKSVDRRGKFLVEFAIFVGILALVQFPIPYLAEGRNELVKHLFSYDLLFDMTLVISAVWLFARLEAAVRTKRRKRAANRQTYLHASSFAMSERVMAVPVNSSMSPVNSIK